MYFSLTTLLRQRRSFTELVVLVTLLAVFATACSKQETSSSENEPVVTAPEATPEEILEPEDPLKEARADAEGKAHNLIMPITEQAQVVTAEIEVLAMNAKQPAARRPVKAQPAPTGHFADERQAKNVLDRNHGAMKNCYERSLRRDPSLRGRVVLKLVVNASGKVSSAKVQGETLHDNAMNECMEIHARTMTFPQPVGGSVQTNVPYVFSPQF